MTILIKNPIQIVVFQKTIKEENGQYLLLDPSLIIIPTLNLSLTVNNTTKERASEICLYDIYKPLLTRQFKWYKDLFEAITTAVLTDSTHVNNIFSSITLKQNSTPDNFNHYKELMNHHITVYDKHDAMTHLGHEIILNQKYLTKKFKIHKKITDFLNLANEFINKNYPFEINRRHRTMTISLAKCMLSNTNKKCLFILNLLKSYLMKLHPYLKIYTESSYISSIHFVMETSDAAIIMNNILHYSGLDTFTIKH